MKILCACEESQAVCKAFRALGHEAYSCDILPCSGGHPEWHLQQDVTELLKQNWDMIIAFPPCTDLCVSGARFFKEKIEDGRQKRSINFFMLFAKCKCEKVAIENPIGIMSTRWRKPDQIIQPWHFGHAERKATCLWLKKIPLLEPTKIVEPDIIRFASGRTDSRIHFETLKLPKEERRKIRSKTFSGIADAMAKQWG